MIVKINNVLIFLLAFFVSPLFSEENIYNGDFGSSITFSEKTLTLVEDFKREKFIYNISIKKENDITFIHNLDTNEKWLTLMSNELMFVYNSLDMRPFFKGVNENYISSSELLIYSRDFISSSYLVEGKINYLPQSIGDASLEKPWVEGALGNGIGETIFFSKPILVENLYLSNGYVSLKKPYLYSYNNRVKKIRITDEFDETFEMFFQLDDTPNPQKIDLESKKVRKLIIEIQDIYSGSKWDDTCINFILIEL